MERRVLQQLRGGPFDPGVRRFGKPAAELLDEPRFAEAGLADDLNELPLAGSRALPASEEDPEVVFAPDERRVGAGPNAPAAAARARSGRG